MPIKAGGLAPDFILLDENGEERQLSQYRGQPVVLYFYPRDDTPGCTKEACGFRDDFSTYEEVGAVILGVSPDPPKSHTRFKDKYQLPFTLLADTEQEVARLYGVWGKKKFMGREYEGVHRTTFLINAQGEIVQVFEKVRPAKHSAEILVALDNLS